MTATVLRWQDQGACKGLTDVMFPEDGRSTAPAKRICATCPVTAECLAFAMEGNEQDGVWGGLDRFERRQLRRAELEAAGLPVLIDGYREQCGTRWGRQVHRKHGERACDRCRQAEAAYRAQQRAQQDRANGRRGWRA